MTKNKFSIKLLFNYFIDAVTGKQTNFTTGSIRKAIFMLSVPMILEMLMVNICTKINRDASLGFYSDVNNLV